MEVSCHCIFELGNFSQYLYSELIEDSVRSHEFAIFNLRSHVVTTLPSERERVIGSSICWWCLMTNWNMWLRFNAHYLYATIVHSLHFSTTIILLRLAKFAIVPITSSISPPLHSIFWVTCSALLQTHWLTQSWQLRLFMSIFIYNKQYQRISQLMPNSNYSQLIFEYKNDKLLLNLPMNIWCSCWGVSVKLQSISSWCEDGTALRPNSAYNKPIKQRSTLVKIKEELKKNSELPPKTKCMP